MPTLAVTCDQCGTSLDVPEDANFLTCTTCSCELAVHRSGSTAYTEVLKVTTAQKSLEQRTDQDAEEVEAQNLKLEREKFVRDLELKLEKLDHEWAEEEKALLLQSGGKAPPTKEQATSSMVWTVITGIVFVVCASQFIGGGSVDNVVGILCVLLGIVFVLAGVIRRASSSQKAEAYVQAKRSYLYRRQQLLQQLEASRDGGRPGD